MSKLLLNYLICSILRIILASLFQYSCPRGVLSLLHLHFCRTLSYPHPMSGCFHSRLVGVENKKRNGNHPYDTMQMPHSIIDLGSGPIVKSGSILSLQNLSFPVFFYSDSCVCSPESVPADSIIRCIRTKT